MKIMVDASICSKGGGVQVALSLIENIVLDPSFKIICVVNPEIDKQLSCRAKKNIENYYIENIEPIYQKISQGKRLARIEEKHNPDMVFVVFGPAYWKPKATTIQGFALGKMLYESELNIGVFEKCIHFVKKKLFQNSQSYLLVETELVKSKLSEKFAYSSDKIFVIGNSYSPSFKKSISDNKYKILPNKGKFRILVPASYYKHKNLENIILALGEISKESNNCENIEVVFTIPIDSNEWKKLLELARNNNVQNSISTVGFVENSKFAELYLESNAVICSSLVESSTAVFPESFLAERPLLVSDRPFAKELCEDAALYFDPLNPKSISQAILKIVNDSNLRCRLIENGQKVLFKNYPSAEQKWLLQKKLITHLYSK